MMLPGCARGRAPLGPRGERRAAASPTASRAARHVVPLRAPRRVALDVAAFVKGGQAAGAERAAEATASMQWFQLPPKVYFKPGSLEMALQDLRGKRRALIVTESHLEASAASRVTHILEGMNMRCKVFSRVTPDCAMSAAIYDALDEAKWFEPDVIVAIGSGAAVDAGKAVRILFERPDSRLDPGAMTFADMAARAVASGTPAVPEQRHRLELVAVPTTSGSGSEVTPFCSFLDEDTGVRVGLADEDFTPGMAIVDPFLAMGAPKEAVASAGFKALSTALESYASVYATDYTRGLSREAIRILLKYLPALYEAGDADLKAREKVHYAATIAGMASANAYVGLSAALAHVLTARFGLSYGAAYGAVLGHVVRFNATPDRVERATLKQPRLQDYAALTGMLLIEGTTEEDRARRLVAAIQAARSRLALPATLREAVGVQREAEFAAVVDELAARVLEDPCTAANPRAPSAADVAALLRAAWAAPAE